MSHMASPNNVRDEFPIRVSARVAVPRENPDDYEYLTEEELEAAWNADDADAYDGVRVTEEDFQAAWDAAG